MNISILKQMNFYRKVHQFKQLETLEIFIYPHNVEYKVMIIMIWYNQYRIISAYFRGKAELPI